MYSNLKKLKLKKKPSFGIIKKISRLWLIPVLSFLTVSMIYGQAGTGVLKGKIIDSTSGKPMYGVTVIIRSEKKMAMTDEAGNYVIEGIPAGTYEAEIIISGYEKMIKKVTVVPGKAVTLSTGLYFKTAKKVVVQTKADNTSASLLTNRKKSVNAQDAISSEEISKAGDSDAGAAAKRITGVSIVDGKYIYVRGMSERYSTILFNGSYIPSPEPDKKIVPLDIFPAGLLDNMVIIKSWTPDLPGEFGASTVQLNPKDFPAEKTFSVSVDLGYDSLTTFKNFKSYNGGSLDWLGFDDGTRKLPSEATGNTRIIERDFLHPTAFTPSEITAISKKFPKFTQGKSITGLPSAGFKVYFGNTYELEGNRKLGIIASALYKEEMENHVRKKKTYNANGITYLDYTLNESTFHTNLGGLIWLMYQFNDDHQIMLTSFYTHQSTDLYQTTSGYNNDLSGNIEALRLIYTETDLIFNQLSGKDHFEKLNGSELNWRASYALALRNEPGSRMTFYEPNGSLTFREESPLYLSSQNQDHSVEFSPDFKIPFRQWGNLESSVKIGGSFLYRVRPSDTRRFVFLRSTGSTVNVNQPLDKIFVDGNLDRTSGLYISEITSPSDYYKGQHIDYAGFAMLDIPIISTLKFVGGMRYEGSDYIVESYDTLVPGAITKAEIKTDNFLPGVALILSPFENFNVRASYSRTVVRPDFKEMSPFCFVTLAGGDRLCGNPNLKESTVDSADLRVEWFPGPGEVLALTGFFKNLKDPIETIELASSGTTITYVNIDKAIVYGAEAEVRVDFGFINEFMKMFAIGANASYIWSEITLPASTVMTNKNRALQGASPFIVNAALYFTHKKLEITVLYNVFGARILRAGALGVDDTYEQPTNRLDATVKWNITENDSLSAAVKNILDPDIQATQGGKLKYSYKDGVSASLGYTHKF